MIAFSCRSICPGPKPGVPDPLPCLILTGKNQVFQHRHRRDRAWHLEGACQAAPQQLVWPQPVNRLAVEQDRAGSGLQCTGDDIEECRFPRPVRADQPGDRSPVDVERAVVDRPVAAECLGDGAHLEDGVLLDRCRCGRLLPDGDCRHLRDQPRLSRDSPRQQVRRDGRRIDSDEQRSRSVAYGSAPA